MFCKWVNEEKCWRIDADARELCKLPADVLKAYTYVVSKMEKAGEAKVALTDYMEFAEVSESTAIRHLKALEAYTVNGNPLVVKEQYATKQGFKYNTYSRPEIKTIEKDFDAQACVDYFNQRYYERFGKYSMNDEAKDRMFAKELIASKYSIEDIKTTIDHFIDCYQAYYGTTHMPNLYFLVKHAWDECYARATKYAKEEQKLQERIAQSEIYSYENAAALYPAYVAYRQQKGKEPMDYSVFENNFVNENIDEALLKVLRGEAADTEVDPADLPTDPDPIEDDVEEAIVEVEPDPIAFDFGMEKDEADTQPVAEPEPIEPPEPVDLATLPLDELYPLYKKYMKIYDRYKPILSMDDFEQWLPEGSTSTLMRLIGVWHNENNMNAYKNRLRGNVK